MTKYFAVFLLCCISLVTYAGKGIIQGTITDKESKEPLIGVNIVTQDGQGNVTDLDGHYELSLEEGKYLITFSYLGYKTEKKEAVIQEGHTTELTFELAPESKYLDDIVITGSLYEKSSSEEVVSISVIKPAFIDKNNTLKFDELARKVPGLNVIDGQANIRAGSGWSYGVGSRVMVVLDGQPVLSPDRASVNWAFLPIESAGQIEVMKGASSVLYGSSAMNGTISIQTIKPTTTPHTKIALYSSVIDRPKRRETQWWSFPLFTVGAYFSRAAKVSPHFEYLLGGQINIENQHWEGSKQQLARLTFMTRWINPKDSTFNYGIRGNVVYDKEAEFFYWEDSAQGALKRPVSNDHEFFRVTLNPFMNKFDRKNNKHEVRGQIYYIKPSFSTKAYQINQDYVFSKTWPTSWTIVTGVSNQFFHVFDQDAFGGATNGFLSAIFAQADKRWNKISITAGYRIEIFKYGSVFGVTGGKIINKESGKEVYLPGDWRLGLNYHPCKNSYLRFSLGQAYRFPSIAERYVTASIGPIKIFDNPNLKPEYGWTSEIGFKQKFPFKHYEGEFDFAFFFQEYNDLVEFQAGIFIPDTVNQDSINPFDYAGFRSSNINHARIAGMEISYKNNIEFNEDHNMNFSFGYTYAYPVDLNLDTSYHLNKFGNYFKDMFKGFRKMENLDPEATRFLLKYRNRHLVTFDLEYNFKDKLSLGFDGRFYSFLENVDDVFALLVKDIYAYRLNHLYEGDWVFNARASYTWKNKHTVGFVCKNMFNNEYQLRPPKIESPRSYNFTYKMEF